MKNQAVKLITLMGVVLFVSMSTSLLIPKTVNSQETENKQRVIVKFRPLIPKFFKNELVNKNLAMLERNLSLKDTYLITVEGVNKERLIKNLSKSILVEYAEEDYEAKSLYEPNDPLFQNQWALTKIKADGAWDVTIGSEDIEIAILDTGININHPDLQNKIIDSVSCIDWLSCSHFETNDADGHGTHVAGIASAVSDNGLGIAGTAGNTSLISVKVLNDEGLGYYSWIADGIVWAADNGADVINLSLGGRYSSSTLRRAVDYAYAKGVVIVAAAGNDGSSIPVYPAYYSNTVAVTATDENDRKAYFSNYGSWVDIAAPGVNILSTYQENYGYFSGTSVATPFVSGVAALVLALDNNLSNQQVVNRLESTADNLTDFIRIGRLNACLAVGCDSQTIPTPTQEPTSTPIPTNIPLPTETPMPTSTPIPTPTSISEPSPTQTPAPTIAPSPTPTPSQLPWWCKYVPWHRYCL